MRLANPKYDVVFKYLMEDREIARLFLGRIIAEEITDIVVNPQEHSSKSKRHSVIIYRLDFKATIRVKPTAMPGRPKNWRRKCWKKNPTY